MRHDRGSYWLQEDTMERLRAFCERASITQSKLVDSILREGLDHLERNWSEARPVRAVFSNRGIVAELRKTAKPKRNGKKAAV